MRISMRGQTLKSKSGYNRSGLSRLVLEERPEESQDGTPSPEEDTSYPRGLRNTANGWKSGEKRKDGIEPEPRPRKRRKLKYPVISEDWGTGEGRDLERILLEEEARGKFLKDGGSINLGTGTKQTLLRVWSSTELWCRSLALEMIARSSQIGSFHSNLEKDLAVHFLAREASESDLVQSDGTGQDVQTTNFLPEVPEVESIPEGRNFPGGRKPARTIKDLFRNQEGKQADLEMDNLDREMRLASKKRLEMRWRRKKEHYGRLRWAQEWLIEMAVEPAVTAGTDHVWGTVSSLVMDLVTEAMPSPKLSSARKLETLNLTAGKKRNRSASVASNLFTPEKRNKHALPNPEPVEEFVKNGLANGHLPTMPTPIIIDNKIKIDKIKNVDKPSRTVMKN